MAKLRSAIQNSVSISMFNKGYAGRIFEEVKNFGAKVVIKNNIPECIVMSVEEYLSMMDEINEMRAVSVASLRLDETDPRKDLLTEDVFVEMLGLNGKGE